MTIREYLKEHRLVTDGAMGTYYAEKKSQESLMSEWANLEEPELVYQIHMEYLEAGAGLIRTNTFAAGRQVLGVDAGSQVEVLHTACQIARRAVSDWEKKSGRKCFIAGDIGPIKAFSGTEGLEGPLQEYKRMVDVFIEEGVDAVLFETFPDMEDMEEAIKYAKEKQPGIFCMAEFSLNKNGYSTGGIHAERLLETVARIPGLEAAGFNCGIGSAHMLSILSGLRIPRNLYFCISPNASYPEQLQNRMVFVKNALYFKENMKKAAEYGVAVFGACCGSNPAYIKELDEIVKYMPPVTLEAALEASPEIVVHNERNHFLALMGQKKVMAVELDPPYDAEDEKIIRAALRLKELGADMLTIADSPQGRSRMDSCLTAVKLKNIAGIPVMPHLCCRDKNMIAIRSTLLGAYANGIRNVLLVTGDPVPAESRSRVTGVFDYDSTKLMGFVREMNREHFREDPLCYGGAVNQGRANFEKEIERVQKKMDAGASYFLTQPIYSKEDISRLRLLKEQTGARLLAGIMPLVSYRNANFVKNEMVGIHVPEEVLGEYREDMSRAEGEAVGARLAVKMMERTEDFVDGYYFMLPFNRVGLMEQILNLAAQGGQ